MVAVRPIVGKRLYPDLRPWDLEPHYCRHISAMTTENLHNKADIAIQLAWRDLQIEWLTELVQSSAPLAWSAAMDTESAHAWERRAADLIEKINDHNSSSKEEEDEHG